MADYFSDIFAPRGSATRVVQTGILPRRRIKAPSGISRVPVHSTRGYFDFTNSANPILTTGDVMRLMSVKSSDRIYELNLWVANSGYGDWAGSLSLQCGLWAQGQNHDGPVLSQNIFSNGVDIVGDAPHRRTDLLIESGALQDGYRGWKLWEVMTDVLTAFQFNVHDPVEEYDIAFRVDSGTPSTQGAILLEMIFAPAGT